MTVVFNPVLFKERFNEFLGLSDGLLGLYFDEACILLNPTDSSAVKDINRRTLLLNLLTAHIAKLNQSASTEGGGLVGRVSSATQGAVSVTVDYGQVSNNQAWFIQTPYGAQYWQSTNAYRRMLYVR